MEILTALLAFSLLMVAFSTIASGLTEMYLRLGGYRVKNLENAVRIFCQEQIWPRYHDPTGHVLREDDLERLVSTLTSNPVGKLNKELTVVDYFFAIQTRERIDALSAEAFLQRFADTEIGRHFASLKDDQVAQNVAALSLSFDRYMATSAELFRKRAQYITFCMSIILAIIGNIQLGKLVSHLQDNPKISASIVAQQQDIVNNMKVTLQALEPSESAGENAAEQATAEQTKDDLEALRDDLASLRDDFDLPIGWDKSPIAHVRDFFESEDEWKIRHPVLWLINTLLAGILIGLGGPFWYKIFKNLGQLGSLAGVKKSISGETVGDTRTTSHEEGLNARAANHVTLFKSIASSDTTGPSVDDTPPPVG